MSIGGTGFPNLRYRRFEERQEVWWAPYLMFAEGCSPPDQTSRAPNLAINLRGCQSRVAGVYASPEGDAFIASLSPWVPAASTGRGRMSKPASDEVRQ